MRFIIFCISENCLTSLFTSETWVPEPFAIRVRLEPLMISGLRRSSGVIERIIASVTLTMSSEICASFASFGNPGNMPITLDNDPIFLSCCN